MDVRIRLRALPSGRFGIEYPLSKIYVEWRPTLSENAAAGNRYVGEHVPTHMLRDAIGSEVLFPHPPQILEQAVELRGELKDGGSIRISYAESPSRNLTPAEQGDAVRLVKGFARSNILSATQDEQAGLREG
jgi:hypothetical protein